MSQLLRILSKQERLLAEMSGFIAGIKRIVDKACGISPDLMHFRVLLRTIATIMACDPGTEEQRTGCAGRSTSEQCGWLLCFVCQFLLWLG
jgi:hypothetical protein